MTETKGATFRVTDTDYDVEGRVVQIARPEGTIHYGYDQATSRHTKTWTSKSEWSYGYDWLGRLVTVADVSAGVSTLTNYNVIGNVTQVQSKQGATTLKTTTHSYDEVRHWLEGVKNKDGSGNLLSLFSYDRRADGQLESFTKQVKQPNGSIETVTVKYAYDAINRLTSETIDSSVAGKDYVKAYTLDLVGNRTKLVETKEGQAAVTTTYDYNARDQLVTETTGTATITYGYDSNGSLISQSGNGSSRTQT